jgi:hypothetical protein
VVTPVFAGVFGKNGRFYVVFCWCDRGGLRGRRGVLAVTFWGSKNTPRFPDLFLRFLFWECGRNDASERGKNNLVLDIEIAPM